MSDYYWMIQRDGLFNFSTGKQLVHYNPMKFKKSFKPSAKYIRNHNILPDAYTSLDSADEAASKLNTVVMVLDE